MSNFLSGLASSAKQSFDDISRGVQGKETGSAMEFSSTFRLSALGLTVSDHGGEGLVSAIVPGGEAERLGIAVNDRVVKVGYAPCKSYKQAVDAIRSHVARPMDVTFERREKRGGESTLGPGWNFRIDEEVDKAERILALMLASPNAGPPRSVLRNAKGLAFLRITKLGLAISARVGTGLVVARLSSGGGWSPPSAIGTVGVSFGFQLGAQLADFLVVLNTEQAVAAFSGGGQVTLAGQIGAVAGPIGASREAGVAAQPKAVAPIFTYSMSKGLFVGVSLEGSVINERNSVNERHYGRPGIRARDVLTGAVAPTLAAAKLIAALLALDDGNNPGAVYSADVLGVDNANMQVPPPAYHDSNPFAT
mmetsp:Transcript_30904/g.99711  ORF Transcript_30904/g.99711 Transcript_30904/m.99711 type:complete len:364 (-) Transcript_30904:43-1134(-)